MEFGIVKVITATGAVWPIIIEICQIKSEPFVEELADTTSWVFPASFPQEKRKYRKQAGIKQMEMGSYTHFED